MQLGKATRLSVIIFDDIFDTMSMSSLSSLSDPELDILIIPRRDRENLFFKHDGDDFTSRYRYTKNEVVNILNLIGDLEPMTQRNNPIDGMTQLLICLRFFATGSFQEVIKDLPNVHKSTICRIAQKVTQKIAELSPVYIKMPNRDEFSQVSQDFNDIAGFPQVLGVVDCTHVKIISRGGRLSELYRGRKGSFSINVQLVCDASLRIRDIVARWPGGVHDCTIFENSLLSANFEMGRFDDYHLLGDSGYFCKKYLLTPVIEPQSTAEHAYNISHMATLGTIEKCFELWKRRCPCLEKGMTLTKTETILNTIVATAVLHNMCIELGDMDPPNDLTFEEDEQLLPFGNGTSDTSVRSAIINSVFSKVF